MGKSLWEVTAIFFFLPGMDILRRYIFILNFFINIFLFKFYNFIKLKSIFSFITIFLILFFSLTTITSIPINLSICQLLAFLLFINAYLNYLRTSAFISSSKFHYTMLHFHSFQHFFFSFCSLLWCLASDMHLYLHLYFPFMRIIGNNNIITFCDYSNNFLSKRLISPMAIVSVSLFSSNLVLFRDVVAGEFCGFQWNKEREM